MYTFTQYVSLRFIRCVHKEVIAQTASLTFLEGNWIKKLLKIKKKVETKFQYVSVNM